MATTTFVQYEWTEYVVRTLAAHAVDWDCYQGDWDATVAAAGMDPEDDEVGVGQLTEAWNGHPAGALIVSGLTTSGYPFAVTTEAY